MLTKARVLLLPLALCGVLSAAAPQATHPFSVDDMLAMDRISDAHVSPDGALVAFTVRSTDLAANKGRTHVWLLDLKSRAARQATFAENANDTNPRWIRDAQGTAVLFLSSRGGSSQVWRLDLAGGEARPVTDLPLDVDAMEVLPAGKGLLVSMAVFPGKSPAETKAMQEEKAKGKASGRLYTALFVRHWDTWADGTRNHLFTVPLGEGRAREARDLMKDMDADCPSRPFGGMEETTVSPDGRSVLFSARDVGRQEAWSTNFDLFEAPSDGSRAPRRLTQNPAWDTQPLFSPDGNTVAYLAMTRPGYESDRYRIVVRDLTSGRERTLDLRSGEGPRGDRSPTELTFSPDGRTLYTTAENTGQKSVFAVDIASGKSRLLVKDGTCSDVRILPGGRLLYARNSLKGPTELWAVAAAGGTPERLTGLNDAKVAVARFGEPEQFTFAGAHGDEVWGYVVKPADFDPAKKYPVAFLIHGGPQGSFGNDFHYRWNPQAYAGAGYAAVMVDFHGSTGYGQAFTDTINGDWGGAPYEDLMKGLDAALAKYPWMDGSRAAALGASFGGYMINWIAGHTDRFKCLVVHDGNMDERMAYYATEELWFPEWEHKGVPWDNPEGYAKHNPIDFVKSWKTPTLVVHGEKDFRVVYTEGLGVFTALQRKGVPSQLLIFPDENHWVLKPANSLQWHHTVLDWLARWTK